MSFADQLLVLMLSMVMNGVSQQIVRVEIIAHIVIQEQSSNFILRYAALSSLGLEMLC